MPEFESETVVSGLTFCGYLLFYLATKQCWSDGNKRIAWEAAMWVLGTLGLTVDVTDEEAEEFCFRLARKEISRGEDCADWIAEHVRELQL